MADEDGSQAEAAAAAKLSDDQLAELFTEDRAAVYGALANDEFMQAVEDIVPGLLAELDAALADDLWAAYTAANEAAS